MPITQDRMRAVIESAQSILENWIELTRYIQTTNNIEDIRDKILDLQPRPDVIITIAQERTHFNLRRKQNDRAKEYMKRHRTKIKSEMESVNSEDELICAEHAARIMQLDLTSIGLENEFDGRDLMTAITDNIGNIDEKYWQTLINGMLSAGIISRASEAQNWYRLATQD